MATLTDITGDSISLEILGYEFPIPGPRLESDYDANWLMIRFSAQLRGKKLVVGGTCYDDVGRAEPNSVPRVNC